MPKLTLQLVTYNGAKYIPYLFESLRFQTFKDWKLFVLDNRSEDNTVERVKKELVDFPVAYELIENNENKGFAGGHNQLFKQGNGDYVLLLNQDMYLMPHCLERLVEYVDKNKSLGALAPRLMRWDFKKTLHGMEESLTDEIDSLGLDIFRSRQVSEWLRGRAWKEILPHVKNRAFEVFGLSGAMVMFRCSALEAVAFANGTIFDESYHSYKEDVDLAFRLRSAGYASGVLVDATAFHDRSAAGAKELGDFAAAANKKTQSALVRYHSYKNHLATLYKNEFWQNFLLDFWWIMWYELKKFGWLLLFDRSVLKGLGELWGMRKELKTKRLKIRGLRKDSWKKMREWWT